MAYMDLTDYAAKTDARLTDFFTGKDVFGRYLKLITDYSSSLQDEIATVGLKRWIDTAEGEQLDILGRIVGMDRTLTGVEYNDWFGYAPFLTAQSYGDAADPSVGGLYKGEESELGSDVTLDDGTYRIFIKAKIMKNIIVPTPESLISFISFVFTVDSVQIVSSGYGVADIVVFSNSLTTYEKVLLSFSSVGTKFMNYFIPKTLGVQFNVTFEYSPSYNFGFYGDTTARGFGSTENNEGGIWSTDIGE